jgi:hypothetical protein
MTVHGIARALTLSTALAAIGLIAAAPASAAGQTREVETKLHLNRVQHDLGGRPGDRWLLTGQVRSSVKACERGRLVKLVGGKRLPGRLQHTKDRTTPGGGARGSFFLQWYDSSPPQRYRVKVRRSFPGGEDRSLKCEADEKRVHAPRPWP